MIYNVATNINFYYEVEAKDKDEALEIVLSGKIKPHKELVVSDEVWK